MSMNANAPGQPIPAVPSAQQFPPQQFVQPQQFIQPQPPQPAAGGFQFPPPAPGTAAPPPWSVPAGAPRPLAQPTPVGSNKPSAFWPLTIIGVLGSLIIGGIGIYFSSQVGPRWTAGDIAGANKASRLAMILGIAGAVCGFLFWLILIVVGLSGAGSTPAPY